MNVRQTGGETSMVGGALWDRRPWEEWTDVGYQGEYLKFMHFFHQAHNAASSDGVIKDGHGLILS